jgi:hypothetical protein
MSNRLAGRFGAMRRLPAHLAVMLGLSTAAYAVSLAAVAADQSRADAATAAARAPTQDAIDSLVRADHELDDQLGRADAQLTEMAAAYGSTGQQLTAMEAVLAGFAGTVADINGVSQALPASVPLPVIPKPVRASVPTTHATTGASGG